MRGGIVSVEGLASQNGLTKREIELMLLCLQELCVGKECRTCKYNDAENCFEAYISEKVKHLDMRNKLFDLDK